MTEQTVLDAAHAAMQAAPEDDALRLRFFERLLDGELFLLLADEPRGDQVAPEVFEVEGAPYVLVFDREERLARFVGRAAPYVGLSGRLVAEMLNGQGIGLALNLESGASEVLLPAEAVDWLAEITGRRPAETEAKPLEINAPSGVPEAVLTALDVKLALAAGLAPFAYLAGVTYADGQQGHMLAFIDAVPGAEDALARAVSEALTFSGVEAGSLDVAFFRASEAVSARLAKVGLRFDLPQPPAASEAAAPAAPGMDPDKPPKLR